MKVECRFQTALGVLGATLIGLQYGFWMLSVGICLVGIAAIAILSSFKQ